MARRFLCPSLPDRGPVRLPEAESRHLATVLRAAPGDEVVLLDGRGKRARARFSRLDGGRALVDVLEAETVPAPRTGRVGLAAAVPKGSRADWMIEKAVEAGVEVFFPILARRGVATAEGAEKRARWERIAAESAKQCGRATLPELLDPRPLAQVVEETSSWPLRLLADPAGGPPGNLPSGDAVVFVGPEGGWAPDERPLFSKFRPVRLGPYTLRVETAALLGVAALANRDK